MGEYYDQRMAEFNDAQRDYENQEFESDCVHCDEDGICALLSDDVVKQPCVEGPCPYLQVS